MTSLISPPILDLSVSYDCDSPISLYNVWKVTNNEHLSCKQSSLLRLNNRSWRLLNEKLLRRPRRRIDRSYLSLTSAPLPSGKSAATTMSQPALARPSLFLNPSNATQHSHLSLNRLADASSAEREPFDSGDDTSDIAEDDEYDFSDDDDVLFDSSEESHCNHRLLKQSRFVDHSSEPSISPRMTTGISDEARRSSAAKLDGKNIFFIDNSPSSPENAAGASAGISALETPSKSRTRSSLFGAKDLAVNVPSNEISSISSTDISDDEGFDLDQENSVPKVLVMPTTKLSSRASKSVTEDNESEWMSISSDSEQVNDSPRTQPLTFAKVQPSRTPLQTVPDDASLTDVTQRSSPVLLKPRSLLSGLFLNTMGDSASASPTSSKSLFSHAPPKPVLKRSSTTGVITVDKNNRARDLTKLLKTSIMLSKRYASFSDISKRMTHFRSPVLFVEEEEVATDGRAKELGTAEADALLAKQTSSVELSNFLATADPGTHAYSPRPVHNSHKFPSHDALEGNLSTSLSKYSSLYPSAGSSFKNILSKSSLNIASLFGLNKNGKIKNSSESNKSSETAKASKPGADPLPALFAGYLLQQNSQDALESRPELLKTNSMKAIKVAPNPIKDFEPSVAISESLKDSLMIDHKLGKIPLPERVLNDQELFQDRDAQVFVEDSNDYYSTGW